MTTDLDQKFDLSLQLDDLDAAVEIARQVPDLEAEPKWKAIGDRALATWRFDLARESFEKAGDLSALMLLLLSIGDKDGLAKHAVSAGKCPYSLNGLLFWVFTPCYRTKGSKQPCFRFVATTRQSRCLCRTPNKNRTDA